MVPSNIPPTVLTAKERELLEPTPVEKIIDRRPNIIVSDVIKIGRKRIFAEDKAAATMLIHSLRYS